MGVSDPEDMRVALRSEPRDAVGELRGLAQEVVVREDDMDTPAGLAMSGSALLVLGAGLGFVGLKLVRAGLSLTTHDIAGRGPRDDQPMRLLMYIGMGVTFVAAVLALFGLVSFTKLVMVKLRSRE